jgi:PncC family amidohydrolase
MESVVGELLRQQRLTLAVAESCTGGLIGHRLSNVPGSSEYFLGDVVPYSYEAKERLLGVPHDVIAREGVVSEAVALAMARGVRRLLDADLALGVTGIAGPGGGTPTKPVGLVYIALVTPQGERVVRYVWPGDRLSNKQQSAEAALALLRDYLTGQNELPNTYTAQTRPNELL